MILSFVVFLMGLFLVLVGMLYWRRWVGFPEKACKARGRVVERDDTTIYTGGETMPAIRFTVRFETQAGEVKEFNTTLGRRTGLEGLEEFDVLYDPLNPDRALLEANLGNVQLSTFFCLVAGLFCLIIGIVLLFVVPDHPAINCFFCFQTGNGR